MTRHDKKIVGLLMHGGSCTVQHFQVLLRGKEVDPNQARRYAPESLLPQQNLLSKGKTGDERTYATQHGLGVR